MSVQAASAQQSHTKRPLSLTPPPLPHRRVKTRHSSLLLRWRGFKNMQVLRWGQWAPQSALLKTISSTGTEDGKKFPGELRGQGQGWLGGLGGTGHMPPLFPGPCHLLAPSTAPTSPQPWASPLAHLTLTRLHLLRPGKFRGYSSPASSLKIKMLFQK